MQYSRQIEINLPRDQTAALFDDPDNLSKWMQGLVSFDHLDGEPGAKGARSRIMCVQGNREIEIIETIEDRVMPFMFKRETEKQMRAFKEFAEAQP